jgi:hypothetical protein
MYYIYLKNHSCIYDTSWSMHVVCIHTRPMKQILVLKSLEIFCLMYERMCSRVRVANYPATLQTATRVRTASIKGACLGLGWPCRFAPHSTCHLCSTQPPILLQISLCKKKILCHIKMSANAWSTKCWWNQKLIAQFCCTLRDEHFKPS